MGLFVYFMFIYLFGATLFGATLKPFIEAWEIGNWYQKKWF